MDPQLTQRQREVLDFIQTFTETHGVPPTVREIGGRFHVTPRAAFDHLKALERKGYLQRRSYGGPDLAGADAGGAGLRRGTRCPSSAGSRPVRRSSPRRIARARCRSIRRGSAGAAPTSSASGSAARA